MKKDYYQILGVDPGADADEVRRAYRRKALELHPDRNGGSREAEEAFKELTEAYAVLGDASRRPAYDAAGPGGGPAGGAGPFDPADLFADPAFA
ncbi:MAG: DnaJ domain-containing protein, partial [Deferrisomatales bacterium]